MTDRILTRDELNAHLWGAADILRGHIDASEFKNQIIGLLFLKRLSDVFSERRRDVVEHYQNLGKPRAEAERIADTDPDEYGEGSFFLPKGSRWVDLMKVGENRAEALDKACRAIEDANSQYLEGVLGDVTFNSTRLAADPAELDDLMQRLLAHFDKLPLGNRNLADPDLLGQAYEYLIERFADTAGKKAGEFYTPRPVVKLLVELLRPEPGMRVCDPTCGSGGMLIECAHYVEAHGGDPRDLSLFGQERNVGVWAIAKMNVLLHNVPDADLRKGDTLRTPKLVEGGRLMTFDRVIANPPFSLKDWGQEKAGKDPFGRFHRGVPPKTKGDMAFVQHMVETCADGGMVGVVMPHGVLFRGASEGQVRRALLEEDLVEAVIGLPPGLFFNTGIPASILVLHKNKPKPKRGKVLFIDASGDGFYHPGLKQNVLRRQDIYRIAAVFHGYGVKGAVSEAVAAMRDAWVKSYRDHEARSLSRIGAGSPALATRVRDEAVQKVAEEQKAAEAVLEWLKGKEALAKFCRAVRLEEIEKENDYYLNIARYLNPSVALAEFEVQAELMKLRELESARDAALTRMNDLLRELGYVR
jgi:type I restriction enzyme M protein